APVSVAPHRLPGGGQIRRHVGVLSPGRLVLAGALGELRQAAGTRVRVITPRPAAAAAVLHRSGTGEPTIRANGVVADIGSVPSERLVESLVAEGVPVQQFVLEQPDLEDVFVELTGEGFDVDQ